MQIIIFGDKVILEDPIERYAKKLWKEIFVGILLLVFYVLVKVNYAGKIYLKAEAYG
jgi:hypothetical protein